VQFTAEPTYYIASSISQLLKKKELVHILLITFYALTSIHYLPILICMNKMKYQRTKSQPNQDKYLCLALKVVFSVQDGISDAQSGHQFCSIRICRKMIIYMYILLIALQIIWHKDEICHISLQVTDTRAVMWRVTLISPPDAILGFKMAARVAKLIHLRGNDVVC
jgi:hypothetical protein